MCLTEVVVILVLATATGLFFLLYQREAKKNRKLQEQNRDCVEQIHRLRRQYQVEREEFGKTLSHSIRMPMAIALGYADLLIKGAISEEKEKEAYLQKLCGKITELNESFEKLLRSMDGKGEDEGGGEAVTELASCIREFAGSGQDLARRNRIRLRIKVGTQNTVVRGRRAEYYNIFYNLLENTIKYAGKRVCVTILLFREEGGRRAVIRFRDNGKGVDRGEAEHIFERDFRGSNSREGTGYGLYLVKRIIEKQGGCVQAVSDRGAGMEIRMNLPCVEQETERCGYEFENGIDC